MPLGNFVLRAKFRVKTCVAMGAFTGSLSRESWPGSPRLLAGESFLTSPDFQVTSAGPFGHTVLDHMRLGSADG